MPSTPSLPFKTVRHFSDVHVPQPAYLGLDIQINHKKNTIKYCVCTRDTYSNDSYSGEISLTEQKTDSEKILFGEQQLINIIRRYADAQHLKIQTIGVSLQIGSRDRSNGLFKPPSLPSRLWLELDAVPFVMHTKGSTVDGRASSALRKSLVWLSSQFPGNIPRIAVGLRHEVEVDFKGQIHLTDLFHYEKTVTPETWKILTTMAAETRDRKLRISFFNSTPQGGGVALMRHALIRLFRLLNIDAHWYVAKPKPEVFDITKRKFHNVLQGVAAPDVRLTDADKLVFKAWSDENVEQYWEGAEGPLRNSDVIIIDDPQVCGIIPHIKRLAKPSTKIIYRSHIEIRADLIRQDPTGPQAETWHFIWDNFIRHADLFISHPVPNFVPDDLPLDKVVLMPATTDPLDGLNKEMEARDILYYQLVFNRTCVDQGSREVDWDRPYVVQVARFDPSKGIFEVLESYRLLREKMESAGTFPKADIPQLVICGHGSIDDPDGTIIYEQTHQVVQLDKFAHINNDIIIARLPPCDQLLNVILRGAYVALQLSSREGFEVKVSEALAKGVPVVAFETGGIPLQIKHDVTGYLVPVGETATVATLLFGLFSNRDLRSRLSETAKATVNEDYYTPVNAINWLFLCNKLSENVNDGDGLDDAGGRKDSVRIGHGKWVKSLWNTV